MGTKEIKAFPLQPLLDSHQSQICLDDLIADVYLDAVKSEDHYCNTSKTDTQSGYLWLPVMSCEWAFTDRMCSVVLFHLLYSAVIRFSLPVISLVII